MDGNLMKKRRKNRDIYDSFISFGNKSFDRVVGKLRKLNLNFAIVSLADELLVAYYNDSIYLDYYEEINTFLESLLLKQSSIKWK